MPGFVLSGIGIRVLVPGNMGLGSGGWRKVYVVGAGCGGGQGWWCMLSIGGA